MKCKVLYSAIFILAVLIMSGCSNSDDDFDISPFDESLPLQFSDELANIELVLTSIDRENFMIRGTLTNNTMRRISYGEFFQLEFLYDGKWYTVPVRGVIPGEEIFGFVDIAHIARYGVSGETGFWLRPYYPFPKAELHRVRREVSSGYYPNALSHELVMEFAWE